MLDKRRRQPVPVGSDEEEDEIAYEDAWYRSLKMRAERQAAAEPERPAPAEPESEPTGD